MIILIKLFLNSKLDLIWTAKFVKQLFRIQTKKGGKVLLWNQVKYGSLLFWTGFRSYNFSKNLTVFVFFYCRTKDVQSKGGFFQKSWAWNLNFKFRIVFWNIFFLEIWRFEKHIALSEKKPPLTFIVIVYQITVTWWAFWIY